MRRALLLLMPLLLHAQKPGEWTSYGKNPQGWRYSELNEITAANVSKLAPQWIFQTGVSGKNETSPLVLDGMLYMTGPSNNAWAIDAKSGAPVWHYAETPPSGLKFCCGPVNRGMAVHGDKLFRLNIESNLVALDRHTGRVLWTTNIEDWKKGYTGTAAPLVVKDMVLIGIAGAEFGTRGFVDAYDVNTGKRRWRFHTVAFDNDPNAASWGGESWKRGGGSTWITGTYDPEL